MFNYADPYVFEPRREGGDIDTKDIEILDVETEDWRLENILWCTRTKCVRMSTTSEHFCCKELNIYGDLNDVYWNVQARCHKILDLLKQICMNSRLLLRWKISDSYFGMIRMCENMMRLLSHSSLLNCDDVRLKGATKAARFCWLCDLAAEDFTRHLVLESINRQEKCCMFRDILSIPGGSGTRLMEFQVELLSL